jgi:hypothetical protein
MAEASAELEAVRLLRRLILDYPVACSPNCSQLTAHCSLFDTFHDLGVSLEDEVGLFRVGRE